MRQLFRVFIPASLIGLILSEFTLVFLCYLAGTWLVGRFINPNLDLNSFIFVEGGMFQIILVVGCIALGLYFQNLYSNIRITSVAFLLQQICLAIGFAFLAQAFLAYIRRADLSV